jgi:PAS domain S-box-containing protein
VIHFRQPSLWETHKKRIIAIVGVCLVEAVLILVLLANLMKRRRAERALRESEDRLSVATSAGDVGVWVWNLEGNTVWASENWHRMFGFPAKAALHYEQVIQRIHADDRVGVESAVRRAVQARTDYAGEYRVALPDGTQRWIAARGRIDADVNGRPMRMLGASVDISERKRVEEASRELSGRLLRAQEEERARLGRELHDDITQRLARLAIDVGRFEQGDSTLSPTEAAREVREGLVRLSEDVHALSYRLHPALVEELGLADALRAECERFSKQHSMAVEIKLRDLPALLPRDHALALFRVAQEALRNVARHARAGHVEVTAYPMEGGLQLAIRDDGIGFDPDQNSERLSLGLASMRERMRLLEGELDIESAPGHGTTVVAWVPLNKAEG